MLSLIKEILTRIKDKINYTEARNIDLQTLQQLLPPSVLSRIQHLEKIYRGGGGAEWKMGHKDPSLLRT